ncbi:MAG TPA: glycosyltransferase family 1 protein, partial [Acidimicrobiia bacterium]
MAPGPAVAIDVTPLAGTQTGIGRSVVELLRALALLDDPPVMVPYAISTRARRERAELPEHTTIIPGAKALARMWTGRDRPSIDRALRDARLLHATNYLVPPSRLPTLVTLHDCALVRHASLCTPHVRSLAPVIRRAIDRGAHVQVPSRFVAREAEEIFGPGLDAAGRIHVIPWGAPPLAASPTVPSELARFGRVANGAPFVVALGTLEPRKNLTHLVAAFATVAAENADLHLVLAGPDGPARPEVDDKITRLTPPVRERVVLTGAVSEPAKSWLLRHAAAVAYPSIYEGFGFPVLEAMAAGVPVVAASAGSIPEIAGDAAELVEPTDEDAMAR